MADALLRLSPLAADPGRVFVASAAVCRDVDVDPMEVAGGVDRRQAGRSWDALLKADSEALRLFSAFERSPYGFVAGLRDAPPLMLHLLDDDGPYVDEAGLRRVVVARALNALAIPGARALALPGATLVRHRSASRVARLALGLGALLQAKEGREATVTVRSVPPWRLHPDSDQTYEPRFVVSRPGRPPAMLTEPQALDALGRLSNAAAGRDHRPRRLPSHRGDPP
jgi:hypothetical protein